MDEQLAQIYGTGQAQVHDEEDLQKTAAAELLVKLAQERGVDLNQFSDEEVAEMVGQLYQEKQAQDAPPFPPKKEEGDKKDDEAKKEEEAAKEKEKAAADADQLGRIMAHAMVQELNNIDKAAAAQATPETPEQPENQDQSALDKLAQERAWEMAKAAGYVDEQGNLMVPETPEQPSQEKTALDEAVETRALQMLEAAGLPVDWENR